MTPKIRSLAAVPLLVTLLYCDCTRPQHLVFIDTDAPVLGQLLARPELSSDAAIDVVRIDVLDQRGQSYEVCEFVASEPSDWPLSFALVPPPGEEQHPARLRIRAFRRLFARPDQLPGVSRICGKELLAPDQVSVSNPRAEVTIDRVLDLAAATAGVDAARVHLALGCIGMPPSFLDQTTCVDETHLRVPFTSGSDFTQDLGAGISAIGTAPLAQQSPCTAPAPAIPEGQAVCIPGGFSIQGDIDLAGLYTSLRDPAPLRPVWVSAFYMDKTEFTVGRVRAQQERGVRIEPPIATGNPGLSNSKFCTWNAHASAQLPVNCLFPDDAALRCAQDGGLLPTEAQWEHAARGRGQRRTYPWGDQAATCCTASLSRPGPTGIPVQCTGLGVEAVGSHLGADCATGGDVSRDGVLDLGGSLIEFNRDRLRPYAERCGLQPGMTIDPLCSMDVPGAQSCRGSYWNAGLGTPLAASRDFGTVSSVNGFRCVYAGVSP